MTHDDSETSPIRGGSGSPVPQAGVRGVGRPKGRTDASAAERRQLALNLKVRGASLEQIARELDVTVHTASDIVRNAVRYRAKEEALNAEELRTIGHARYEALIRRMWTRAFPRDPNAEPDYKAVDSILRTIKQDAVMMGYESPQKHDLDIRLVQAQIGVVVEAIARVLPDSEMHRVHDAVGEALTLLENQEANRV